MPRTPTPRRQEILDAALRVVTRDGLRGLTHRAVDREAGLAEGSTSAYLRTRKALQLALTEHISERLTHDIDRVAERLDGCEADSQEAIRLIQDLFVRWIDGRDLVIARVEMTMEAARDPDLAAVLIASRERIVAVISSVLESRGEHSGHDESEVLLATLDGILITAMLRPVEERDRFLDSALAGVGERLFGERLQPGPGTD